MIIQWKRRDNTESTARWNGLELRLVYEAKDAHLGPWRLYVDGAIVKQRWFTPMAAMAAIDAVQTRLIVAQSAVVRALQRPMEVRRAGA
jgi:hypothetical protein